MLVPAVYQRSHENDLAFLVHGAGEKVQGRILLALERGVFLLGRY
jgi:hypothetical protein